MRVVHPREREIEVVHLQPVAAVAQVEPAARDEGIPQIAPGQRGALRWPDPPSRHQIPSRVLQRRCEVVVGAEHEHAGYVEQVTEGIEHSRHSRHVRQIVARVHHQIGPQAREITYPGLLLALPRREVQVRNVKYAEGVGIRRQDGRRDLTQRECTYLVAGRIGQTRRSGGGESERCCTGCKHPTRLPHLPTWPD
jgi:hypothetical protein